MINRELDFSIDDIVIADSDTSCEREVRVMHITDRKILALVCDVGQENNKMHQYTIMTYRLKKK